MASIAPSDAAGNVVFGNARRHRLLYTSYFLFVCCMLARWPSTSLDYWPAVGIALLWGVILFVRRRHRSFSSLGFYVVMVFNVYLSARLNECACDFIGVRAVLGVPVLLNIALLFSLPCFYVFALAVPPKSSK